MRVVLVFLGLLLTPWTARSQFAEPPAEPLVVEDFSSPGGRDTAVRVHVGPALDLGGAGAGLFAALDVGRGRVGGRFSGAAVALGTEGGSAVGSAELWVAPVELGPLRALLGAGAGVRDESPDDAAGSDHVLAGVAVLRAGLELGLPVAEADARLGASVAAHVPAVVESGAARTTGLAVVSLALGF